MELSVVHNLAVPPEEVGWTGFAKRITDQANKCLKDSGFKTWAVPTFSTTTETDKTVACVAMMGCLKEYFSYAVDLLCGLPSVTLLGQKKDYENILDRVEKLRDVSSGGELTQFADLLKPVIQHFILSFDAPESDDVRSFWGKIFTTITNGSGPIHWSGWLTAFMFWDKDGQPVQKKATPSVHNKHEQLVLHGLKYPIIPNEMPPGFCTVPVKIVLSDRSEIQAEMLAGSVGIQASSSDEEMANGQKGYDTRQPVSGWWVYEKGGQPLRNGARADSIDR